MQERYVSTDYPFADAVTTPIYGPLRRGRRYRISKSFRDNQSRQFSRGEIVTFIGHQFSTYSQQDLFYWLRGDRRVLMKLDSRWVEDQQILTRLDVYFECIDDPPPARHAKKTNKAKQRKAKINQHKKH